MLKKSEKLLIADSSPAPATHGSSKTTAKIRTEETQAKDSRTKIRGWRRSGHQEEQTGPGLQTADHSSDVQRPGLRIA